MEPGAFMMNGTPTLYVDQYGNIFWKKTIKDIRSIVPRDEPDDGSNPFFEPGDVEDLELASAIARDSSGSNFLTKGLSVAFLNCIARLGFSTVALAAMAALLTA
jgi:hypothetical protein